MKRSHIAVIAAITALGCVSLAVVANAHTVRFDSQVTIQYHKNGQDPDSFRGKVTSDKDRCEPNRTVALFRKTDGSRTLIDTDRTNADGEWEIVLAGDAPEGTYFARVRKKFLLSGPNHRHVCKPDRSPDRFVNEPGPP
jgi:hypothetical protein